MNQLHIYTALKRGELHPDFCEDAIFAKQLNASWLLVMVADGCSAGQESYFAATLWKKLWAKIVKLLPYRAYQDAHFDMNAMDGHTLSKYLVQWFWEEVKMFKNDYYLEVHELVATMLVGLYHIPNKTLSLVLSGDGVYAVNGQVSCIDQEDKPNYLAYHLDQKFEDWWSNELLYRSYEGVTDFAISTDGVLSFAKDYKLDDFGLDIPHFLLVDELYSQQENMLARKVIDLYNQYQLLPNDDFGMVRCRLVNAETDTSL